MEPQTATEKAQAEKYIGLLLQDLREIQVYELLDPTKLTSARIAELEVLDAEVFTYVEIIRRYLRPEQVTTLEKILQVTPKTLANLKKEQLDQLIAFFQRINPEDHPISATLSAEDRKRLVSLYEEHLRLQNSTLERKRLVNIWQEQIKEYHRQLLRGIAEENPTTYTAYEAGINHATEYILHAFNEPDKKQYQRQPADPSRLYGEFILQVRTALAEEITRREQQLTTIPITEVARVEIAQKQLQQIRSVHGLLDEQRADTPERVALDKVITNATARINLDYVNGVLPTQEQIENRVRRLFTTSVYVADALSQVKSHQVITVMAPFIAKALGVDEKDVDKRIPQSVFIREQRRLQGQVTKLTESRGDILTSHFFEIQSTMLADIEKLKAAGYNEQQIKNLERQIRYLNIDDVRVFKTEEDAQKKIRVVATDEFKSPQEIATLLTQREITRTIIELQDLREDIRTGRRTLTAAEIAAISQYVAFLSGNSPELSEQIHHAINSGTPHQEVAKLVYARRAELIRQGEEASRQQQAAQREERREFRQPTPTMISTTAGGALSALLGGAATVGSQVSGGMPGGSGTTPTRPPAIPFLPPGVGGVPSWVAKQATNKTFLIVGGIIALFVILFLFPSMGAMQPTTSGGADSNRPGKYTVAQGSCPVTTPVKFFRQTFDRGGGAGGTGHGSADYWSDTGQTPFIFPIPDGGISGRYCKHPTDTDCSGIYGQAIDVQPTSGNYTVFVPQVCAVGQNCSNQSLTWTANYVSGRGALYLTTTDDNGTVWKLLLLHMDWNGKSTYITGEQAGTLKPDVTPKFDNTHLHFELSMDDSPIDPTPFCDGSRGSTITVGSGPYCSIKDPYTQLSTNFGSAAETFSCICDHESNGDPGAINDGCLPDGKRQHNPNQTLDYSVGLFQINLLYRDYNEGAGFLELSQGHSLKVALESNGYQGKFCADAFEGKPRLNCVIRDQQLLDICVEWFSDPVNNMMYARNMWGGRNLSPWAADQASCGF